jgi:hypothetical protein
MKFRNTILAFTCAAVILAGDSALGANRYFRDVAGDQDFGNTTNWSGTSCAAGSGQTIPGASDGVIICPSKTCNLDADRTVRSMDVGDSGAGAATFNTGTFDLTLTDSAALDVSAASSVVNVNNSGALILTGGGAADLAASTSEVRLLGATSVYRVASSAAFSLTGDGAIVGSDASAGIEIGYFTGTTPAVLTSSVDIRGALAIRDVASQVGSFTNNGIVEANASGNLTLAVSGTLEDSAGDRWLASSANSSTLKFDAALVTISTDGKLSGNFKISDASSRIWIDNPLVTEGRLEMSAGILDVDQDLTMGNDSSNFASITGGMIDAHGKFIHE